MCSPANPRFSLVRFLVAIIANLALLAQAEPPASIGRKLIEEKIKSLEPKAEEAAGETMRAVRSQLVAIETAKDQWSLVSRKPKGTMVQEADLLPYFPGGESPVHFPGGEFAINPVGTPPASTIFGTADDFLSPSGAKRNYQAAVRVVLSEAMVQLTMIENAKRQWGLENKKSPGTKVYEANLLPYFLGGQAPAHSTGGKFIINPLGTPPESTAYGKLADFSVPAPVTPSASKAAEIEALTRNTVINQLRIIAGAKDQWSLVNSKLKGTKVEEADLIPYFVGREAPVHPPGGKFIINPVGTSPESTVYGKLP
jgi:hypothetical protein